MKPAVTRGQLLQAFFWLAPVVFLVTLFHRGLDCWFLADDFAWLGLSRQVHSFTDLVRVLFEPAAQGTIRPWSDRGFFLLFEYLFGPDPWPFRIMAFATMAADALMVNAIVRKLAASPFAGCIAALCWTANTSLMTVMTWSAAYNQALCPLFMLTALACLIRYLETGRRKWWWWQLVVFSLGLGALEIDIVYPTVAAAWILFVLPAENTPRRTRRSLLIGLWPLFLISLLYGLLHRAVAPVPTAGPYVLHLDARIFHTLAVYIRWSLLPVNWVAFGHSPFVGKAIVWISVAALLVLAVAEFRRRRATALFFLVWYLATLAPVLVLPEHLSDYYLTIPTIGLGMLFGYLFSAAGPSLPWRALALVPVVGYLVGMIPISISATEWSVRKALPVKAIVLGSLAARQAHPDKTILLDGISQSVYEDSIGQSAFAPFGLGNVYVTPESGKSIASSENYADTEATVLEPSVTLHALKEHRLVVYSVVGDHLRNITEIYERFAPYRLPDTLPSRVDAGNPLYAWLLGPGWLQPDDGVRWMTGHAAVRLKGPQSSGSKLELDGFFPEERLKRTPRVLKVSVDHLPVGELIIRGPEGSFHRLLDMPPSLTGREAVEVELEASPVDALGGLEYGMVFGGIAVRPSRKL